MRNTSQILARMAAPALVAALILIVAATGPAAGAREPRLAAIVPDSALVSPGEERPYYLLIGEADSAVARGDYATAAERLNDMLRVEPWNESNVLVRSNLGMIYSYLGRDSLALAVLDEALREAPAMTHTLGARAMVHLRMGHDDKAYRDFAAVIAHDSINTTARYYHGMMALYSGRLAEAEDDFAMLQRVAPKSHDADVAMATLYGMTGRDREAIPYYRRLVVDDPSPEYSAALAGCYLSTGELIEASQVLADAMRIYPDDPELYYYRAWLNRDLFRFDEAKADARRAVALGASPQKVAGLFDPRKDR